MMQPTELEISNMAGNMPLTVEMKNLNELNRLANLFEKPVLIKTSEREKLYFVLSDHAVYLFKKEVKNDS